MLKRRNRAKVDKTLLAGPGSLAKALGITTDHTGLSLMNGQIWIEDQDISIDDDSVLVGPRVGIDYAGDDASRPYRFRISVAQPESLNQ
jgi:DNA-3-methyladenine glycosylase